MEVSRWLEPCFSPDLGKVGAWLWVPRLIMPWSISISSASMLGSPPSPGSFSPSPLLSASSPVSRSSSSGLNPRSSPSNGGAPRELLGGSFWSLDRMKCPPWSRVVEENAGEWPEQPWPWPEGAGVLDSNLWIPRLMGLSSLSSLDETCRKVAENDSADYGAWGNIMAQLLGKVSTMAWTTPAMPHQSGCFACRGQIHSSSTISHMLIWNWKVVLRAFAISGPWAAMGPSLHKVSLIFLRKASTALSAWAHTTQCVVSSRCMTGSSGSPLLITCFHTSASLVWVASWSSRAFITVATYSLIALRVSSWRAR